MTNTNTKWKTENKTNIVFEPRQNKKEMETMDKTIDMPQTELHVRRIQQKKREKFLWTEKYLNHNDATRK